MLKKYCFSLEMLDSKLKNPEVGMGATVCGYSDREAYTVIGVTKSGKTITMQKDKATLDPSFKPEFVKGGFCATCINQNEQKYNYEPDTEGQIIKARKTKKGWMALSKQVIMGKRSKFYDYNF